MKVGSRPWFAPECGAPGAQGWNIDYLALVIVSVASTAHHSVKGSKGVEGGGGGGWCLTRCWVLRDRAFMPGFLGAGASHAYGCVGWWPVWDPRHVRTVVLMSVAAPVGSGWVWVLQAPGLVGVVPPVC